MGGGQHRAGRPRWLVLGGLAVSIALVASLFAFGLGRDPNSLAPVIVGKAAPAFDVTTLDGERTIRLADLRGQVVVLNFWASWCVDCRIEQPALSQAWTRYRDHGVLVLGMSFEDAVPAAQAYARDNAMGWPLVTDPGSRTAIAYGVAGVPETFLIGPDGMVRGKTAGPLAYGVLSDQIAGLLPGAGA
jgi:cytochrome c biogenesis protein CcmG/thiol:disulfide interchange protein DsbE